MLEIVMGTHMFTIRLRTPSSSGPPFRDEVAAHRRDRHDDRINHELYIIDGTDLGAEPLLE